MSSHITCKFANQRHVFYKRNIYCLAIFKRDFKKPTDTFLTYTCGKKFFAMWKNIVTINKIGTDIATFVSTRMIKNCLKYEMKLTGKIGNKINDNKYRPQLFF